MTDVVGPSLRRELRALGPWLLVVCVAWAGGVVAQRARGKAEGPAPAPWQRSYLSLSVAEQRLFRLVREGILEAENARAREKAWPEPAALAEAGVPPFAPEGPGAAPLAWARRQHGVYVTYVGLPPAGAPASRWLVLFIEPEPRALKAPGEAPAPVDEEHHTLPDGTALHVTVWTQANEGPLPEGVPAFPVAEGWTQRLGR
ncbi:MAG: hypothetical protein HY828_10320 [Actinobacteria bacterium]|nr:hypothetical protein [Actinomycetota bacterium]